MVGLGIVSLSRSPSHQTSRDISAAFFSFDPTPTIWHLLLSQEKTGKGHTKFLLRTRRVLILGICAAREICQRASVTGTVLAPACIVDQTVIAGSAARVMAKCSVTTGDETAVELLSWSGIACSVAHENIWFTHGEKNL